VDLHAESHFAAEPDAVAAMLVDEEFLRQWCEETKSSDVSVTVSGGSGGTPRTARTSRAFPTDAFPSFVRSFVGDSLVIEQTDTWEPAGDGSWNGTSDVSTVGAPARLRATARLEPEGGGGGGTRQVVDGEVKASVPLVGGKVEQIMHERVLAALRVQERLAADWRTPPTA
jgi:uncharacterized protein YndB with AHSA1/START domain